MKTIQNSFLVIAVIMLCNATNLTASDETQLRNVRNYNAVKVSAGIDLFLSMGNTEEVKVVADDNIIENLITEVKNGTLHIYMKKNLFFNLGNKTMKVYVKIIELNGINASSGSEVISENTLKGESLNINASSGSDADLTVEYNKIDLTASSAADVKLTGQVSDFKVNASSGSDVSARNLEALACHANASSGANITVNVVDKIDANASSGADINYYGNPESKNIEQSSGGDVSRK